MAKKKICIFIGSSIVEFKEERMELENFIHRLSNDFEDRYDTRVIPVVCEAFDPAMARTRKQDDYLESMRGCEMCFFLFYTRAGEYTREEFREAYQTFLDKGAPKVYVYFKELGQDEKIEPSLTEFMAEVDKTYKHFYNMFSHLDTVKLRILLGIKLNAMDYLPIEVEGNACKVGGHTLEGVDLRNVPEYANSKELAVFGRQLKETEEIYLRMKGQYDAKKGDEAFYREYAQVAAHYHQLKKTVADQRSDLFELMLKLDSTSTSGEVTPRMKEACRLLETGDKEGCIRILNDEERKQDYYDRKERLKAEKARIDEQLKREAIGFIRERKLAIDVLETMYLYEKRHEAMDELYREIVEEWKSLMSNRISSMIMPVSFGNKRDSKRRFVMPKSCRHCTRAEAYSHPSAKPPPSSICLAYCILAQTTLQKRKNTNRRPWKSINAWRKPPPKHLSPTLQRVTTTWAICIPTHTTLQKRKNISPKPWRSANAWRKQTPRHSSPTLQRVTTTWGFCITKQTTLQKRKNATRKPWRSANAWRKSIPNLLSPTLQGAITTWDFCIPTQTTLQKRKNATPKPWRSTNA